MQMKFLMVLYQIIFRQDAQWLFIITLTFDELDCQVAIIKNARSGKMGRKDIIKVEGPLDIVDFDILGFIDHNITVDIIKDGELVEKRGT